MKSHPTTIVPRPRKAFGVALLGALGAAVTPGCGGSETAHEGERWNVLVVTLDTTRPDRISCYGGAPGLTPALDALSAEGARFERAVSTAGITPMSHSSILTGLNNYSHGMRVFYSPDVSHRLKDSVDTLPEILKEHGYKTVGRVSSYPVSKAYNLDQGFDDFDSGVDLSQLDLTGQQRHETSWDTGGETSTQRRGDITTKKAVEWLEKEGKDGPWCMWLHMFDVHDYSVVPPRDFAARFSIEYPDPREVRGQAKNLEWRERMYDPELAFMDMQIARIRDWLVANDQYDRTIIVVTADHGQGLTDGLTNHGWMKHRLLYDWSVHVPMIVRIPGAAEPGTVVPHQVRTIDVMPTILETLEIPLRQPVEGKSMLGLLRGETEPTPRLAYADALNLYDTHAPPARNLPPGQKDNLFMVCDGRWKLIWHERNPSSSELYDLVKDPEELRNLYDPGHGEVDRLRAFLIDNDAMAVEPPGRGDAVPNAGALGGMGYNGGDPAESDTDPAENTGDGPKEQEPDEETDDGR